jgi:hypothetical protein
MELNSISWPVYRLRNEKPSERDGIHYYAYENYNEEGERTVALRIVDDKTIDNPKLSLRRLAIKSAGLKLFRLTKAIFFLGDLIKLATAQMWFIDSAGKIFQYTKSTRCKLKFHKITKVIRVETGGAIIEVQGVNARFKSLYYPESDKLYAGILHYGMSPILYGYYDQKYDDTWRMI